MGRKFGKRPENLGNADQGRSQPTATEMVEKAKGSRGLTDGSSSQSPLTILQSSILARRMSVMTICQGQAQNI